MNKDKVFSQRQRVQEWFKESPQEWLDLKAEMETCLENATDRLRAVRCDSRDFSAGECSGIKQCMDIEKFFKSKEDDERN